MNLRSRAIALLVLAEIFAVQMARAGRVSSPLGFFEGVTETTGTLKVLMRRSSATRSVGHGKIEADGSLSLVQRVEDEGKPPYLRRWVIRQVAPGHFSGTMSEASGLVTIDEIGHRYRFRFKIDGGMAVEQWLTPLPDGRSAATDMKVRKLGIEVASASGVIRKLS